MLEVLSEDGEGRIRGGVRDRLNTVKMHEKPYGFMFCLPVENAIEMCLNCDTMHGWVMPCSEVIDH